MRKRRAIIIGAVVAGVALVFWLSREEPQRTYKGHSLSYWVHNHWPLPEPRLKGPQPDEAILNIGTNALPFLLCWIQAEEPSHHVQLSRPMTRLPDSLKPDWARSDYTPPQLRSAHAFKALGTLAIPAVPQLAKIAADSSRYRAADMALTALFCMGSNGAPTLLAAAQDTSHPYRNRAIYLLGISLDLSCHQDTVVTNLLFALKDPSANQSAAYALGYLAARPEIVVPGLANCLKDTNTEKNFRSAVIVSLIYFAEKSAPALPQLTNALSDPEPEVRQQATNAIARIQLAIHRTGTH